ncbi:MAG: HEAT repeat domain-containing protein [Candidatus Sericytochromatia bacterium]|nr:HEAT repeat domain-containing protein [Candidatus Sericytochromatia bacterium]
MGFLDFLSKKQVKEPEINYEAIIANCWNIFRQGLKHPNPAIRRTVEQSVWNIDTPEGKRFFATGMQEPDINNKIFCLEKLYERGGWRLSENLIKIALDDDQDISLEQREEIIYFLGVFSDSNSADFLLAGLKHKELRLRIAILFAISGVKGSQSIAQIEEHLKTVTDDFEKFACGIALYQFNKNEGKNIVDEFFSNTNEPKIEYLQKLKFIDFNKAQIYFNQFSKSNDEVKKTIIRMIEDNRGIDLIKLFLHDSSNDVANTAINQVIQIGSRSTIDIIKQLKNNPALEKNVKYALAAFSDKEAIKELEDKVKNSSLEFDTLEDLQVLGLINDQNVSEILDKILISIDNIDNCSDQQLEKIKVAIQILIKFGKMSSIIIIDKYCSLKYLENEDIKRWELSCNSAAAILCTAERNTTYYTLRKKVQDEQQQ